MWQDVQIHHKANEIAEKGHILRILATDMSRCYCFALYFWIQDTKCTRFFPDPPQFSQKTRITQARPSDVRRLNQSWRR